MNIRNVVAVGLLIFAFVSYFPRDFGPAPSPEWQARVAPIKALAKHNRSLARPWAKFYQDSFAVLGKDQRLLTVGQYLEAQKHAIQLAGLVPFPEAPDLVSQIERVFTGALGGSTTPLDRPKLLEGIRALVWAFGGKLPAPNPGPGPPPPNPPPLSEPAVVIIRESDIELPFPQVSIFTSVLLRDYLDSKNVPIRVLDQHTDLSKAPKLWQDAMARPRTGLPWIIVSGGLTGYEGPLPANTTETLNLCKKVLGE